MLKDWKLITDEQDLKGKTIKSVYAGWCKLYISFTDTTYCTLNAFDDGVELSEIELDAYDIVVRQLGMLSAAEVDEIEAFEKSVREKRAVGIREHELKQLAELKAKYPDEV